MPTADLRALAERLGMLKPCAFCTNGEMEFACESGVFESGECPVCAGLGTRLPTEAEVRSSIFEAGWTWMDIFVRPNEDSRLVIAEGSPRSDGPDREGRADLDASDQPVLLALLRALEAARDGR